MPLLDLPAEIRAEIFAYVVGCPSDIIALTPGTSSYSPGKPRYRIAAHTPPGFRAETISLSFLRTCKKIYADAKDIIWQINILDIEPLVPVRYMRRRTGPLMADISPQLTSRVQNVRMEMQFMDFSTVSGQIAVTGQGRDGPDQPVLFETLKTLGSWPSLKTLTLLMCERTDTVQEGLQAYVLENESRMLERKGFTDLLFCRDRWGAAGSAAPNAVSQSIYHEHLDILRHTIEEGLLSLVKRQVVMNLGAPVSLGNGGPYWNFPPAGNPDVVLVEIGTAFQCPVIVYGRACVSDGVLVHNPFTHPPPHMSHSSPYATVVGLANLIRDITSMDIVESIPMHQFLCSHMAAFSSAPVQTLLEQGYTADGRAQLEARTDLWDAIREQNIPRFFSLLES